MSDPNNLDGAIDYQILMPDFQLMIDGVKAFSGTPKVVYLRKKGVKLPQYVTWSKWSNDLIKRFNSYVATYKKKPAFVWINKPGIITKVCNVSTVFRMQPNNWTCGVTVLRMIASRHGLNPSYEWVVSNAWANPTNGTGHAGFRNVLTKLGFSSAISVYRKDKTWKQISDLIKAGYDIAVNLKTGGLSGWAGNWPHWVLLQCVDVENGYVWIHDPDKGASIRHDIYTMNDCEDNNPNPDYVIAKK